MTAIGENRSFTIVDTEGNTSIQWTPGTPIPPDPRIWEGMAVNELPCKSREARKNWMKICREERKRQLDPNHKKVHRQPRASRKIESREKFLYAILHASCGALERYGKWGGFAAVDGRQNIPLVKVESTERKCSKLEVSLAGTVARCTQRDEKRAERAEKGKGKGYKKRERAEKQTRIE